MMKAVCFLMVLTAFGCALGQRKGTTLDPTRNSSDLREGPPCPEDCSCMAIDQNPHSSLRRAICDRIPVSLHQNIKSLQVDNLGSYTVKSPAEVSLEAVNFDTKLRKMLNVGTLNKGSTVSALGTY
jgi:hypothetical protein